VAGITPRNGSLNPDIPENLDKAIRLPAPDFPTRKEKYPAWKLIFLSN
jgi:hypothetical protein